MEQKHKIRFEETTTLDLAPEELKTMYIYLALFQYKAMRKPDYNEKRLLQLLSRDIRKFLSETHALTEQIPNNHTLHRLHAFFENHHKHLIQIVEG